MFFVDPSPLQLLRHQRAFVCLCDYETDVAAGAPIDYAVDDDPSLPEQPDDGAQEPDDATDDYYYPEDAYYYMKTADD